MPTKRAGAVLAALALAAGVALIYWRLVFTNRVLAAGDALTYFVPYRDYANAALRSGHLPLWNPYLFLGAPFLANPQAAVLYPLHWPLAWLPAAKSLAGSLVLHLWLAGLGTYLYGRRVVRLEAAPALLAGLVFSLSGYLGAHAAQVNQVSAAAWLPWLLWLLEEADGSGEEGKRGSVLAFAGLAAAVGLQFLAGHTQTSYINLVALALAAAWPGLAALSTWGWNWLRAGRRQPSTTAGLAASGRDAPVVRDSSTSRGVLYWFRQPEVERTARRLALAAAAVALGALLAGAQLLPTWELAQQSVRSGGLPYREAVSFSLPPRGLLLSLLPAYGEDLAARFGTPAYAEFVAYVGVSALALAVLAVHQAASREHARPFLSSPAGFASALALIGFILAIGLANPLYFVLYKLLPGFDLFRAPARWMLLYAFGVSVLAGIGMQGVREFRIQNAEFRGQKEGKGRRARLVLAGVAVLLLASCLAWQKWPGPATVSLWLAVGLATVWLATRRWRAAWRNLALLGLVVAELAAASLALDHTRPTAPEAITSLRTAPAHLLTIARQQAAAGQAPGRFLSLSGITYDPGDLADMQHILAGQLPQRAIYDFVVASKLQEIVAPNLSLLWRLPAVDGYDGGVLPLRRYVQALALFAPADELTQDGRLREQLQNVPPSRLLRLLGVEHVITDKVFDVWLDGVYYDLQMSSRLSEPDQAVQVDSAGRLEATALGVFSHLEGASDLPAGAAVAEVIVVAADGARQRFELRAGEHTAEGAWQSTAAHGQPAQRQPWPRQQQGWDYLARFELPAPTSPEQIIVRRLAPSGAFVVRGVSLIDERTGTHAALTMPADGDFERVHSGDVKIYRNLAGATRAYAVGQARVVADDEAALAALADPAFDPAREVVLLAGELQAQGLVEQVANLNRALLDAPLRVESYEPERVALRVAMPEAGVLVLADSWDPGWQATVDGRPAAILRGNLLFRAVILPAGEHDLVFEFRPASLRTGALASALAGVILLSLVVWSIMARRPLSGSSAS